MVCLQILLHHILRNRNLLLVSNEFVDEAHILRVQGVQEGARTGDGGGCNECFFIKRLFLCVSMVTFLTIPMAMRSFAISSQKSPISTKSAARSFSRRAADLERLDWILINPLDTERLNAPVERAQICRRLARRRRDEDKLLHRLELVGPAHGHEVGHEGGVVQQHCRVVRLSEEEREHVGVVLVGGVPMCVYAMRMTF